jgi:hypothetical protein
LAAVYAKSDRRAGSAAPLMTVAVKSTVSSVGRSLPVYPDKQPSSEPGSMSQRANSGLMHRSKRHARTAVIYSITSSARAIADDENSNQLRGGTDRGNRAHGWN